MLRKYNNEIFEQTNLMLPYPLKEKARALHINFTKTLRTALEDEIRRREGQHDAEETTKE